MSPGETTHRLTAREIPVEAKEVGEDELKRSRLGLGFSGLAAGPRWPLGPRPGAHHRGGGELAAQCG